MPFRIVVTLLVLAAPAAALADTPVAPPVPPPATLPDASGWPDAACPPVAEPCPASCYSCLCGPPGRLWVSAEWLYWASSGNPLPPLVTASPPGTVQSATGVLGGGPTSTLFGGGRVDGGMRSGFRLQGVAWLNDCQTCGLYGDFFFLGRAGSSFVGGSPTGTVPVGRPFVNALTGRPDAELVSFPGVLGGTVTANSYTDVIGGGGGLITNLCCTPCGRLDLLLGYRYLQVTDDLTVTETLAAQPGGPAPPGSMIRVRDHFRARNEFHGPNVGVYGERRSGRYFVAGWTSLAMGVSHQTLTVDGSTVVTGPTGAVTTVGPGGLLTAPSNIGTYTRDRFAVVPEIGMRVGYQVTPQVRAFVGYTFIYLSNVTRTGDMIDLRVNPNLLPPAVPGGPAAPRFNPPTTDFWVQGVSLGAQFLFF